MNPTESLREREGSPAGWLGRALARGRADALPNEEITTGEVLAAIYRDPVFRGVEEVCLSRLRKARKLTAREMYAPGSGFWEVLPNEESDSQEVEHVNLAGSWGERCHCADFLYRCEDQRTLCKHILAALLASGHEGVLELARKQERDDAIAAALQKGAA